MVATHPLAGFLGTWQGEEEIMPTQWGPGGPASAQATWRLDLGGKTVIHEYSAVRDGQTWLQAHAVFTSAPEGTLAMHWFDSLGFVPQHPADGEAQGPRLVFVRRSPRGMARHIWAAEGTGTYTLLLESSFDGGANWVPVMRGRYQRTAAS